MTPKDSEEWERCLDFEYFCRYVQWKPLPQRGATRYVTRPKPKISFEVYQPELYHLKMVKNFDLHSHIIFSHFMWGGFTLNMAAWALHQCLFRMDSKRIYVRSAGHSFTTRFREALFNLPIWMRATTIKSNESKIKFENGNQILFNPRWDKCDLCIIDSVAYGQNPSMLSWNLLDKYLAECPRAIVFGRLGLDSSAWFNTTLRDANNGKNAFMELTTNYLDCPKYQTNSKFADAVLDQCINNRQKYSHWVLQQETVPDELMDRILDVQKEVYQPRSIDSDWEISKEKLPDGFK